MTKAAVKNQEIANEEARKAAEAELEKGKKAMAKGSSKKTTPAVVKTEAEKAAEKAAAKAQREAEKARVLEERKAEREQKRAEREAEKAKAKEEKEAALREERKAKLSVVTVKAPQMVLMAISALLELMGISLNDSKTEKTLDLDPPYQRGQAWKDSWCVTLIESILAGRLIHPLTFSDRVVVDGKQRLIALSRFVSGDFSVYGATWQELELPIQERFLKYQMRIDQYTGLSLDEQSQLFGEINHSLQLNTNEAIYASSFDTKHLMSHTYRTVLQPTVKTLVKTNLTRGAEVRFTHGLLVNVAGRDLKSEGEPATGSAIKASAKALGQSLHGVEKIDSKTLSKLGIKDTVEGLKAAVKAISPLLTSVEDGSNPTVLRDFLIYFYRNPEAPTENLVSAWSEFPAQISKGLTENSNSRDVMERRQALLAKLLKG